MPNQFSCIYCCTSSPSVVPSKAHVFPHVMGGVTSTEDTVCKHCNHKINQDVEMPALPLLDFFRLVWGIKGRRNRTPRIAATLFVNEHQGPISLNERGEPRGVIVCKQPDSAGRNTYVVSGPNAQTDAKRQEIAQRYPTLQWSRQPVDRFESVTRFEVDPTHVHLRRLAAKVAFERLAQLRGSALLIDREYDTARAFILTGDEPELCCGVLADASLLCGPLNFPLPYHAVVLIAHPNDIVLGAFVTFYSLFYYWVILSRRHRALWPWDDLLLEHPQARDTGNPQLRQLVGSVRAPWSALENAYRQDPLAVKRAARVYATQKFQAAVQAFYGPRKE